MNYTQAGATIKTARCQWDGKPLKGNTCLRWRGTHYVIRLHETDILDIFSNGSYRLRTRGWRTKVTKERLNRYLPAGFYVFADKGEWYLRKRGPGGIGDWLVYEFKEEMTIGPRGGISTKQIRKIRKHSPPRGTTKGVK